MPDLESQVRKSILTTMHGKEPLRAATADLASFLQTLPPPPSRSQTMAVSDLTGIEHGSQVFQKQSCNRCHRPPTYTSRKTYDVGLEDAVGNKRFNPPSLRGVSQGGPYFHDNRAATLEEVLDRFKHQLSTELSQAERKDLLIFLRSL
jgi:cytochrome c peroxidase